MSSTSGITLQTSSGLGERAGQPFYQARFAVASRPLQGSTATIGVAGHYGKEIVGATQDIDSWAFAFDFRVPILSRLILRGEGYLGSNLVPFGGGVIQGVAAVAATGGNAAAACGLAAEPSCALIKPIGDGGGWAELTLLASKRNVFYVGGSTDDPVNKKIWSRAQRNRRIPSTGLVISGSLRTR